MACPVYRKNSDAGNFCDGDCLSCVIIAVNAYDVNTETWEQKGTYRNGYLLNYVLGVRDSFISAPEGYSKDKIKELEKTYQSDKKDYSTTK